MLQPTTKGWEHPITGRIVQRWAWDSDPPLTVGDLRQRLAKLPAKAAIQIVSDNGDIGGPALSVDVERDMEGETYVAIAFNVEIEDGQKLSKLSKTDEHVVCQCGVPGCTLWELPTSGHTARRKS